MKDKIYIVDGSTGVTGALKSSLLIAEALDDLYQVEFVLPDDTMASERVKSLGYKVHKVPIPTLKKKVKSALSYFPKIITSSIGLKNILKSNNVNILILNDFDKPVGLVLKMLGWNGRVYTFVRRRPLSFNRPLSFFWVQTSLLASDYVIAVSEAVLKELPHSNKIIKIYNSVNLPQKGKVSSNLDINPVRFLCLGNYMMGKGQKEALEAFLIAYENNKNIRLHFAGGDLGLEKNRDFKESLKQKVRLLKLTEVVTFEGYVEDVENTIMNSHIVLNLSVSESFSRVCVEAASFKRPVIATMSGGPQEIISHGDSGFLVEVGDIVSVAEYIDWFAKNPQEIQRMGELGNKIVYEKFSFDIFKKDINELLIK